MMPGQWKLVVTLLHVFVTVTWCHFSFLSMIIYLCQNPSQAQKKTQSSSQECMCWCHSVCSSFLSWFFFIFLFFKFQHFFETCQPIFLWTSNCFQNDDIFFENVNFAILNNQLSILFNQQSVKAGICLLKIVHLPAF